MDPFPLSDPTIILGDIEVELSSPILRHTITRNPTTTQHRPPLPFNLPVIPLSSADFSAAFPHPIRPTRKRALGPFPNAEPINNTPRFSQETNKSSRDLILSARDLIVQAYTLTESREEQSKLLGSSGNTQKKGDCNRPRQLSPHKLPTLKLLPDRSKTKPRLEGQGRQGPVVG